jgi:hypothetical protein
MTQFQNVNGGNQFGKIEIVTIHSEPLGRLLNKKEMTPISYLPLTTGPSLLKVIQSTVVVRKLPRRVEGPYYRPMNMG